MVIPDKQMIRASVWIEQEIAIASFMEHTLQKKLNVACFIQEKIEKEGVREYLHLNPIIFSSDDEVLSKLQEQLPKWESFPDINSLKLQRNEFSYFHRQRIDKINNGAGVIRNLASPKVVLHLAPLSVFDEAADRDADLIPSDLSWQTLLQPLSVTGWDPKYNQDGVYTIKEYGNGFVTYVQLFRRGIIEAVEACGIMLNDKMVDEKQIEEDVIAATTIYLAYLSVNMAFTPPFSLVQRSVKAAPLYVITQDFHASRS